MMLMYALTAHIILWRLIGVNLVLPHCRISTPVSSSDNNSIRVFKSSVSCARSVLLTILGNKRNIVPHPIEVLKVLKPKVATVYKALILLLVNLGHYWVFTP